MLSTLTDELGRFVRALVEEVLEGVFQCVRKLFVAMEAFDEKSIELLFEFEQLVDHLLVLIGIDYQRSTMRLR